MMRVNLACGCGAKLELVDAMSEILTGAAIRAFQDDHKECPKVLQNIEGRLRCIEESLHEIAINTESP